MLNTNTNPASMTPAQCHAALYKLLTFIEAHLDRQGHLDASTSVNFGEAYELLSGLRQAVAGDTNG